MHRSPRSDMIGPWTSRTQARLDAAPRRSGRATEDVGRHPAQHDRRSSGRRRDRQRRRGAHLHRARRAGGRARFAAGGGGRRTGQSGRDPHPLRHHRAVRRDRGGPPRRRGLRPGGRRRPRRPRPHGVRRGGRRRGDPGRVRDREGRGRGTGGACGAGPDRRCMDHLHVRVHRQAEGRGRHPPLRGRLHRRRGQALSPTRTPRTGRPGDGRAVGGLRRVLRGDLAGLGVRRVPGARSALAGPQWHGPGALADGQRRQCGLHGADPGVAVADGGDGRGAAAHPRWGGLPAGDRGEARHRRPGGVEHLRTDRGHRGVVRRAPHRRGAGPDRAAPRRLGPRGRRRRGDIGRDRWERRADHRRGRPGALPRHGARPGAVRADAHARVGPGVPQR